MGKFHQCLTELSACETIMAGYYSLKFLLKPEDLITDSIVILLEKETKKKKKNSMQKISYTF